MEDLHRVDIKIPKEELKWLGIEAATLGISRRQLMADIIINNVRTIISIRKGASRPTPDYISISTDEAVSLGLDKEPGIDLSRFDGVQVSDKPYYNSMK